ncbi:MULTISPECIES: alpha-D-ribose 1-methylphosphonate 5-triphosphate diphosphatase [Rhizobium]|uniref:Alpha-D-ribose 1-methylphosphonate 5-triphosphate diphosphatase n=1 Tax=Rhizobium tropici TaxID=398 RepID=A0A6P1C391_RHITR|nr:MULTISPECIES: alpha-D-ribose 1-methylphosphonate 5-triphosphate diphosphatase [Rhizobium]AGB74536.1 phosphonate metabolism PhnM [Rhizobium tropici CIAT 899]MBB4242726.1 alpha-D-ribose 1-methylphosphonate 5-triphosphate diphosphatase [Rhizobium tropici]MBB5594369.1 alpha-D-ribose 1-methylphosphonate 5-triphosphate diphosphatase [Rhizobium tropici]MBB6493051.1 alpha-D-ribose 1-methylphosphonate 5-triphosphate diphosphatase [Rhizobium tropici]NEV10712.1 alpha-D-ribose 1-methylphosphonate 5-tri
MHHNSPILIEGATVVFGDRLQSASIRIEEGRITDIDGVRDGAAVIDGRGHLLGPAFVDVHGDAFERQLMPRPGTMLPVAPALLETDRQLAANGIATAFHALTLSWEPGLRSVDNGRTVVSSLDMLASRLMVDNRVQLRWETFCFEAIDLIRDALSGPRRPSIAFNDHTSMLLLDPSVSLQERPFDLDPNFPALDPGSPVFADKMAERAKRAKLPVSDMIAMARAMWERRPQVLAAINEVSALGEAAGAPMLSHDDSQIETRDFYRARGARLCEFPMNRRVARAARDAGDFIVFGAPNATRGGSHLASIGAADMIREGLCDILASDYYYPAMLLGLARLKADGMGSLQDLWPLVSGNPARASGLHDRGTIRVGSRADLILVEWPEGDVPVVRRTWVAGREAYRAIAAGH